MKIRLGLKIFKMELASKLAFRGRLFVDVLVMSAKLLVPLLTWTAVYRLRPNVGGYGYDEMMSYLIVGNFVGLFFSLGHGSTLAALIKQGKLSTLILRPASIGDNIFPRFVAQTIVNSVLILCPVVLLLLLVGVKLPGAPGGLALLLVLASWIFSFQFGFVFGLLAFWITEMWAVAHLVRSLMVIAGGTWFPLDVLPWGLGNVLQFTPFSYMGFVSIKALTGSLKVEQIHAHLVAVALWILVFYGLIRLLTRFGLRRYETVGG